MQLQYHQELQVIQFHVLIVELFLLKVEYVDQIHVELNEQNKTKTIKEYDAYFLCNKYYLLQQTPH